MAKVKENKFQNFKIGLLALIHLVIPKMCGCRLIFAIAFLLTFGLVWMMMVTSKPEFYIESEPDPDYEGLIEIDDTFQVFRNVHQPSCEILSIVKKQTDSTETKNDLCGPREGGTNMIDVPNAQNILRKSMSSYCVKCCYMPALYNENNNVLELTDQCFYFSIIKEFSDDRFIMLKTFCIDLCGTKEWNMSKRKLEISLHTIFSTKIIERVQNKMNYWDNWKHKITNDKKKPKKIIRIILINIENLSRQEGHKNLPKTLKKLEDTGYIEMKGFSHINNEPITNLLASLTGLSSNEWDQVCSFSKTGYFDECPFIWKRLSALEYITSYAQDDTMFKTAKIRNHQQHDFLKKPVDYFLEHQIYESLINNSKPCKYSESIKTLLEFTTRINKKFKDYPLFSMTRITTPNYLHNTIDLDYKLTQFFHGIEESLSDSLVAFYSTNGFGSKLGKTKADIFNKFEPILYVSIPKEPKKIYQDFQINLSINSGRLTTMYDFYEMLEHIVKMTCNAIKKQEPPNPECIKLNENIQPKNKGTSFLFPISPHRNCSDASIPEEVCPCDLNPLLITGKYSVTKSLRHQIGHIVLSKLNSLIPNTNLCSKFILNYIEHIIPMKDPPEQSNTDFLVRFNVRVRGKNNLKMEIDQRIRVNKNSLNVETIGLPIWASRKKKNGIDGYNCMRLNVNSNIYFSQKLYCHCKI